MNSQDRPAGAKKKRLAASPAASSAGGPMVAGSVPKAAHAYHHGDLRQALVALALGEVEKAGAGAVSLAALAKAAGVSQAAPYRHFADRDALLAAVATEGFKAFGAALTATLSAPSERSGLSRMCHAYVAFGLARPGLYHLMFASPLLSQAKEDDEISVAADAGFNLLVSALGPEGDGPRRARRAQKIWASLHGIVMLVSNGLLLGVDPAGASLDQLVDDVVG